MKKQPIELIPGLRIGVGIGRLILSHSARKEDGLEMWAVNYQLNIDGPIRETFYMSSQIIRELLKVEHLERENKTRYEYGRRYFNRCAELQEQLTRSENLREVANKVNQERIDNLENESASILEKFSLYKQECDSSNQLKENHFLQLHKIIECQKESVESLEKSLENQRFWTFGLFATSLMFFAMWLSAMYF